MYDSHKDVWHKKLWLPGFAQGGYQSWKYIGQATSYKNCIDMVQQKQPSANGASFAIGGLNHCHAQFNLAWVWIKGNSNYQTISFVDLNHRDNPYYLNSKICFKKSQILTKDFDDDHFGFMVKTGYDEPIEYTFQDIGSLGCDGWMTARFELD